MARTDLRNLSSKKASTKRITIFKYKVFSEKFHSAPAEIKSIEYYKQTITTRLSFVATSKLLSYPVPEETRSTQIYLPNACTRNFSPLRIVLLNDRNARFHTLKFKAEKEKI